MTLEELLKSSLESYDARDIISGHLRLHQWYSSYEKDDDLAKIRAAHQNVFLEFIRRGIHHNSTPVDELDKNSGSYPSIPPELYSTFINPDLKPGESGIPDSFKRWHASLHNLWLATEFGKGLKKPEEQLINAHDIVVKEMDHHPLWDELDNNWINVFKSFSIGAPEGPLYLEEVLLGFPESVNLITDAVKCYKGDAFIAKGIDGVLRHVLQVKLLRRNQDAREVSQAPVVPDRTFDLKLSRSCMFLSETSENISSVYNDHYWISRPFIYLVGGIVEGHFSINDADVLIKRGVPGWLFQHISSLLILEHPLNRNLHFLEDEGLGPLSSHVALYDLILESKDF